MYSDIAKWARIRRQVLLGGISQRELRRRPVSHEKRCDKCSRVLYPWDIDETLPTRGHNWGSG